VVFRAFRSPIAAFGRLVPKDRRARLVERDVAYGGHSRQRLDVYAPRRPAGPPLPIVVFFYGGSWASGLRQDYAFAGRAFAAAGFLTAVPDYRLVPEAHWPDFVEDCAAAVNAVRARTERHGGDPDRIVLIGHSAGAYNAAMLALDRRWLGEAQAAVRGFVGLAGPYDFLPLSGPVTSAAFGRAKDLPSTQPVNHALAGSPPALLLHGAGDRTVRPRNSRELAGRLADAGCDARLKLYPKLGHVDLLTSIALPFRRRAPVLADSLAFAREVCG
jgi:acetyl esterase/lipase